MKQLIVSLVCILLYFSSDAFPQMQWETYLYGMDILDIAPAGDILWCTSVLNNPGEAPLYSVIRYDISLDTYEEYLPTDGIPEDYARHIVVAQNGDIWCGGKGLSRFDGTKWERIVFEDGIGHVPNIVGSLAVAPNGDIICATFLWNGLKEQYECAISRFDGYEWIVFTPESQLERRTVTSIAVAPSGEIWCSTGSPGSGVYCYDGQVWQRYTTMDGLNGDDNRAIAAGADEKVWCGRYGLSHYDGQVWQAYPELDFGDITTVDIGPDGSVWYGVRSRGVMRYDGLINEQYTVSSGLPSDYINRIVINNAYMVYAATDNGVAVHRVSTGVDDIIQSVEISLISTPNPFNASTMIRFELPVGGMASLVVYDTLGRKVRTLHHGNLTAGAWSLPWDGRDENGRFVSSGIYFPTLVASGYRIHTKMLFLK